jgi:hypothetical protein
LEQNEKKKVNDVKAAFYTQRRKMDFGIIFNSVAYVLGLVAHVLEPFFLFF